MLIAIIFCYHWTHTIQCILNSLCVMSTTKWSHFYDQKFMKFLHSMQPATSSNQYLLLVRITCGCCNTISDYIEPVTFESISCYTQRRSQHDLGNNHEYNFWPTKQKRWVLHKKHKHSPLSPIIMHFWYPFL